MRKLIKIALFFLTLVSALTLLLAYLSVHVNPEVFWFLGLIGLAYPFLLLVNIIFLVYWIVRWKRYFIISLIAILLGVSHFTNFFQLPFGKENQTSENQIKVLTYNVHLFQLYAWAKEAPTHNKIFKFIKDQNPDIVCLQEFYIVNNKFSELEAKSKLNSNVHIGYILKKENSAYGMATYSRYPIIETGQIKFDNSANACIYTDLLINADTIRVYNIHLQSLRLKERNLNFLLSQNYRKESQKMQEIKDISFRYRDALKKRAQQVEKVTNHILSSPHPVIVCGDFNESPISYNYYKMRKFLNDAFVEAGIGVGHTYRDLFPSFRIDYVLYDKSYRANGYSSPRVEYSDHYPVITTLVKKE